MIIIQKERIHTKTQFGKKHYSFFQCVRSGKQIWQYIRSCVSFVFVKHHTHAHKHTHILTDTVTPRQERDKVYT